jgi:hypothetical protein
VIIESDQHEYNEAERAVLASAEDPEHEEKPNGPADASHGHDPAGMIVVS